LSQAPSHPTDTATRDGIHHDPGVWTHAVREHLHDQEMKFQARATHVVETTALVLLSAVSGTDRESATEMNTLFLPSATRDVSGRVPGAHLRETIKCFPILIDQAILSLGLKNLRSTDPNLLGMLDMIGTIQATGVGSTTRMTLFQRLQARHPMSAWKMPIGHRHHGRLPRLRPTG
jgi:hypothetical protein